MRAERTGLTEQQEQQGALTKGLVLGRL